MNGIQEVSGSIPLISTKGYEKRLVFVRKQAFSLSRVITAFSSRAFPDVRPPMKRAHQRYLHTRTTGPNHKAMICHFPPVTRKLFSKPNSGWAHDPSEGRAFRSAEKQFETPFFHTQNQEHRRTLEEGETVFLPYRADRSMMDLLITGLVHRTEYDDKTKEPFLHLYIYTSLL